MRKKIIITISIIIVVICLGIMSFMLLSNKFYNKVEIDKNNLGIDEMMHDDKITETIITTDENGEEKVEQQIVDISGIKNIALFGLDRRTSRETTTRSDSIMVATVNFDTKEVKLTSFMRDMYVDIEGYGKDKLNHAYAYGGPELAIKTLNQNFGLNIKDYVAVDFLMLEEIINTFDGVDIEVDENEVALINEYMEEVAVKNNLSYTNLEEYGLVRLNGAQATAFARIRKVGNGDYERTERQRIVLSAIIEKSSKVSLTDVPKIASSVLKNTETSISEFAAINMASNYLLNDFKPVETERIPRDGSFTTGYASNGMWIMKVDYEKEVDFLKGWIYGLDTEEYQKFIEKKKKNEPVTSTTEESDQQDAKRNQTTETNRRLVENGLMFLD